MEDGRLNYDYAWRWIWQVIRQVWSFGRDQAVGLSLAVLILLYQFHSGLLQSADLEKTSVETIAYPYLTLIGVYVLYEVLRAPFVLNREQEKRIQGLTNQRKESEEAAALAEALRENTAAMRSTQVQTRLRDSAQQAIEMSRAAQAKSQASKLAAFIKDGKELFEWKFTGERDVASWKLSVDAWHRDVIASLTDAEAATFDAPISNAQEALGHSGSLSRLHGDMRGRILVWVERLNKIMERYAS